MELKCGPQRRGAAWLVLASLRVEYESTAAWTQALRKRCRKAVSVGNAANSFSLATRTNGLCQGEDACWSDADRSRKSHLQPPASLQCPLSTDFDWGQLAKQKWVWSSSLCLPKAQQETVGLELRRQPK